MRKKGHRPSQILMKRTTDYGDEQLMYVRRSIPPNRRYLRKPYILALPFCQRTPPFVQVCVEHWPTSPELYPKAPPHVYITPCNYTYYSMAHTRASPSYSRSLNLIDCLSNAKVSLRNSIRTSKHRKVNS